MFSPPPDWLGRDVIACLEEKCGTLVDAVLIAYESASVGDELHSFGVRNLSGMGAPEVYVPEGRERVVWEKVVEYHGCAAQQPQSSPEAVAIESRVKELVDGALARPEQPTRHDLRREGKDYPGAMVEEVVRQATAAQLKGRKLGRTLRNELAASVDEATTYAVDAIFRLMKRGILADGGRPGWLEVAGQSSATASFINLLDLEAHF